MKIKFLTAAVALTLVAGFVAEVSAQPNPNLLVNSLKGAMTLQGKYFGPIVAMSQGRTPYDAAIVQRNADYLAVLTQLPWDDFQPITVGVANSRTKEEAFKDPAKFKAAMDGFQVEVKKLVAAARGADQAGVTAAVKAVGGSCNSCHESFATFDFKVYRAQ